jgi:hypothetical protein
MWEFSKIGDNNAFNGYDGYTIKASNDNRDVVFFLFNNVALNASGRTIDQIIEELSQSDLKLMDEIFKISSLNNNKPDHHPRLDISEHVSMGLLKKILQEPTLYKPE